MRSVVDTVSKVLEPDVNVLILGESGSGKDYVAEAIHSCSARRGFPFVHIDCSAIPSELFESELFGYEKGAFTDAQARKPGRLELAEQGTIYLDEVARIDGKLQAKLLRAIQERRFTRLGGNATVGFDARILSSSSLDARQLLEEGGLRRDLYYRLNVVSISIPPLRERREDIPLLAKRFLKEAARRSGRRLRGVDPAALQLLVDYSWPGNVRELRNIVDRAVIVETGELITTNSLPIERFITPDDIVARGAESQWTLDQLEERYIREVLRRARDNYSRAAQILGINRKTLLEKRRKYGIA
jgi:two-component system response regulator AtoC